MKYITLANGWINKSQFFEKGSNRPAYIGNLQLDESISKNEAIDIALWERDGAYSIKISKKENQ